uniref:Pre-mRNA-splicing factor SLU7 n=1 Tax=Plectus sambesii TaxID=2011161 RepID=A0A914UIH5_9BILA
MATFAPTKSVSEILKEGGGAGEMAGRQSKDEYRKMKELEEQRKEGTAPAMVDVDTGRDINPHIPQFISQTPWYVGSTGPTLKHQRPHEEREQHLSGLTEWYKRGVTSKVATKFRKGACENCGAMTHKKKDCFERPRNQGARWTGDDIAPDDHMQPKLEFGYDAKRDRWNGYDPSTHKHVVEEFQKLEETRKMVKAQMMKEGEGAGEEKAEGEDEGEEKVAAVAVPAAAEGEDNAVDDEDKYAEDADMAGVTVDMDSRTRITVRNLRIREDTAKYLYNLDPNGPYYDPKSRSMRENPFAGLPGKEAESVKFSGENFIRYSGEVMDANEAQVFAWQARIKGIDVHALAEPTKLEALKKEFKQQKSGFKDEQKQAILDKYGGE